MVQTQDELLLNEPYRSWMIRPLKYELMEGQMKLTWRSVIRVGPRQGCTGTGLLPTPLHLLFHMGLFRLEETENHLKWIK